MGRRKSKLTVEHEDILVDEIIPDYQHRKWLRTTAVAIWVKCGGATLGGGLLIELVRTLWHLGGGGGGGIP